MRRNELTRQLEKIDSAPYPPRNHRRSERKALRAYGRICEQFRVQLVLPVQDLRKRGERKLPTSLRPCQHARGLSELLTRGESAN